MSNKLNVVMLCSNGDSSRIMYNGIESHVNICRVIIENSVSGKKLVRRRIKNLGLAKVIGQLLFMLLNKFLKKQSKTRANQLLLEYGLNNSASPEHLTTFVDSVNDEETINMLKQYNPDAVVVNGTRIISTKVLSSINAPFINTHMGITPRYRGVHGGYWALAMGDTENCGVTVHLVDEGIDTGGVLYQGVIYPDQNDGFNTYPLHQIAKAIPLMRSALDDVKDKCLSTSEGVKPSHLWYHPTIIDYLKYRITKSVK